MEQSNPTFAKILILDTVKFEQWKFKIQQYLQNEHYALWKAIEFGDSYEALLEESGIGSASESSTKKKGRTVAITTKDMQKRRNDVKARTTLLLALPDEHQLRFSKYKTAQELWGAILKTFGGNEATKKTKKDQLKHQYGNFKQNVQRHWSKPSTNCRPFLAPEWLMYTIVWRNRNDLDTLSLDDIYNHLKVYEPEVQKKSESNSHNMAFISSANTSSGKREVNTASIPTVSTQISPASANVVAASISHDTVCTYIVSQSNGSQIKYEDINQIDEDDIEEMDIKWNMVILSMRANRFWKKTGKKITIQGTDVAGFDKSKVECFNCHKMGHFARECRAPRSQDRGRRENYKQGSKEIEPAPKALMSIDRVGWDWSYMANEEENHALVADDEARTEFSLMAKSSSSSENEVFNDSLCSKSCKKNTDSLNTKITNLNEALSDSKTNLYHYKLGLSQVEARLVEFKTQESKFCEKIRGLEFDVKNKNTKIENLMNELEHIKKEKEGYWDSGCSQHMTGNIFYLSDYEPYDGGYVSFGQRGGKITGKVTKASVDESMLWHRRLAHLNFKIMNNLVRHNLVKGLPSKCFENDHTCVAFLKGKQHKASCKTKLVNSVSKPLHTLHMDLFGPTFVSSLNHKWYCLVVTDEFSRFTWTFFLKTKDETSGILRNFITEIENLKDLKVKIIRCDNGGEFKNKEMHEFCIRKGIKREFSNARTPQQNGVVERRNGTLIEAARTMLADAKLPITFWAEVINTACYVQNRVLVNKSQNKTPYELFN
nr:putative ribonuclease H-like domain-containing protein [Tanacetum cinerariifolium]